MMVRDGRPKVKLNGAFGTVGPRRRVSFGAIHDLLYTLYVQRVRHILPRAEIAGWLLCWIPVSDEKSMRSQNQYVPVCGILDTVAKPNQSVQKLLGLVQKALVWPLFDHDPLESWVHPSGNVALLGDACWGLASIFSDLIRGIGGLTIVRSKMPPFLVFSSLASGAVCGIAREYGFVNGSNDVATILFTPYASRITSARNIAPDWRVTSTRQALCEWRFIQDSQRQLEATHMDVEIRRSMISVYRFTPFRPAQSIPVIIYGAIRFGGREAKKRLHRRNVTAKAPTV
ncbi:hypothetical protein K438DRAFT_1763740 [Mycena galopus ATCC 62051]|nr:hypothetical protein K438DRAFT_1763740 [Mycena galopus ATCC 62051]